MTVPFYRPSIDASDIEAVSACLRSGWITTGGRAKAFEEAFASFVGAPYAVAVNSCTAALHLSLEAIGLQRGDLVLVPALTFAATAEVVRYFDAVPVFVDAQLPSLCLDVEAAHQTVRALLAKKPTAGLKPPYGRLRAIIPMHYGGQMADMDGVQKLAKEYGLRVIEDAAHTLPAAMRSSAQAAWRQVGTTAELTCFSFYANKCITTGEGGMVVTHDPALAERMRIMALHGMSKDAWKRFTGSGAWYYEIVAPGFKYNLTDIAAALGLGQLARAEALWQRRRALAARYQAGLGNLPGIILPHEDQNRQHSWHLFAVRLVPQAWKIDRAGVIAALGELGVSHSVHWMPLPLHPYYVQTYGYRAGQFPVAEQAWQQLLSLPLFPSMRDAEADEVIAAWHAVAGKFAV